MFDFYNNCLNSFNIFLSLFWWNYSGCLQNFLNSHQVSDFCCRRSYLLRQLLFLYKFTCFMDYFFERRFLRIYLSSVFARKISHKWPKSISFNIYSCFLFFGISHHFYLLISKIKLTLSSISNGLSLWSLKLILSKSLS